MQTSLQLKGYALTNSSCIRRLRRLSRRITRNDRLTHRRAGRRRLIRTLPLPQILLTLPMLP